MKTEEGTPKASVFYMAYTRDDVSDVAKRPIMFTFNGGPGSSSVWLHLGAFGPRRVEMGDAGALLPPPYKLVDNESSLLDVTDLVFIDPVSTGYSRPAPGESPKPVSRRPGGRAVGGRFHPALRDAQQALVFAEISCRRKLWNDARSRPIRLSATALRDVFEWNHSGFHDSEFPDCGFQYGK